jgi:hypothetical protein
MSSKLFCTKLVYSIFFLTILTASGMQEQGEENESKFDKQAKEFAATRIEKEEAFFEMLKDDWYKNSPPSAPKKAPTRSSSNQPTTPEKSSST